jgi:hypothetical protein
LENKFHAYFYSRNEEKIVLDLTSLSQKANESGVEFIRWFREVRNLCYLRELPDNQLTQLAIRGLGSSIREKLAGVECEKLSQLSQKVAAIEAQSQSYRRENRFRNSAFLDNCDSDESDDDVAVIELKWSKKSMTVPKSWSIKEQYDFDVNKLDNCSISWLKKAKSDCRQTM